MEEPSHFPGCGLSPEHPPSTLCVMFDWANLIRESLVGIVSLAHDSVMYFSNQWNSGLCSCLYVCSFFHSFIHMPHSQIRLFTHIWVQSLLCLPLFHAFSTYPSLCQAGHMGGRDRELSQAGRDPRGLLVLVGETP